MNKRLYEILIKDVVTKKRFSAFNGLTFEYVDDKYTRITGLVDQSTLYSLITKIRDMGLIIKAMNLIEQK